MGGVVKAFKSIFSGSSYKTPDIPTPAATAAPADTSVEGETDPNNATKKRRSGKSSLMINYTGNTGGTGLNL